MTALAPDASGRVATMGKPKIRGRNLDPRHDRRPRRIEADVTGVASRRRGRGAARLAAIDRVTARAHVFIGQQSILDAIAAGGVAVAALAGDPADREVLSMVEAKRKSLRGIDRSRRPAVVAPALPHPRDARERPRPRTNPARCSERDQREQPQPRSRRALCSHG